jgi:hypothetical protein
MAGWFQNIWNYLANMKKRNKKDQNGKLVVNQTRKRATYNII